MKTTRNTIVNRRMKRFVKERELWILSAIMLAWVGIMCYYPMFGLIIAFKRYVPGRPVQSAAWVGTKYFMQFFSSPDFPYVIRNTLVISGLNILFGFPAPILLAVMLNEMRMRRFKRIIQTVSYLPHFISWVVTASLLFTLLNSEGLINRFLLSTNLVDNRINWLNDGKYFWGILVSANIWKNVGFASIIFLSAMSGIDQELYQAGAVDGLGRAGQIWHITLPGIRVTVILLGILQLGSILNAGFEQQLLLGNDLTRQYYEVIDTYAYKYGVQLGNYSYGTAVGLMKGLLSVSLVFLANALSRKTMDIAVI